ncbi:hypothetical protein DSM107007_44070 [Nostoc sp. PCC 7120 = FACHB-418]|nr:hypothetical protein DSM107007_44070 [Nostoc sp. PCC 7120 = FACHB-418]
MIDYELWTVDYRLWTVDISTLSLGVMGNTVTDITKNLGRPIWSTPEVTWLTHY